MSRKLRNFTSLLLTVIMLTGIAAGCGAGEAGSGAGTTAATTTTAGVATTTGAATTGAATSAATSAAAPSESANVNEYGWEIPAETLVLDTFYAASSYAPPEEEKVGYENMRAYMLEKFNVEWTMSSTGGDLNEAINLMLAANDYPAIIYGNSVDSYNHVLKFVSLDKAQDITPYIDSHIPNIKAEIGEDFPLYLDDDGKLFYIPRNVGGIMESPENSAHIRVDEWNAIGSPEINTPDDYYQALNDILAMTPVNANGETRYAMSFYDQGDSSGAFTLNGFFGIHRDWKIEDGKFTYWVFSDEAKKAARWVNQFHRDGTMDPDAFVNKFDDWRAKFSAMRIAGAIGGQWIGDNAGTEVWQVTEPDWNDEMRVICVNFKDPDAEAAYLSGKRRYGGTTILTDKVQDLEGVLEWCNFLATEPGKALGAYGIPNGVPMYNDASKQISIWTMTEDGQYSVNESVKELLINDKWDYIACRVTGELISPLFYSSNRWKDGNTHYYINQMWIADNKWRNIRYNDMAGSIYDETPWVLRVKTDQQIQDELAIREAWKAFWPLVITSDDDAEFDEAWKNLQDAVTAAGIEGYTEAVEANYQKNLSKMEG